MPELYECGNRLCETRILVGTDCEKLEAATLSQLRIKCDNCGIQREFVPVEKSPNP